MSPYALYWCVPDRAVCPRKVVMVAEVVSHPSYSFTSGGFPQNDIGLLRLAESVPLGTYPPACLPVRAADFTGLKGWVYGALHCQAPSAA